MSMFAALGGGLVSSALGLFGQNQANKMNRDMSRENNAFNEAEAEKNRRFQELMSSSAHQRQVADMKAAGLNPILSANQGGASAPTGASASAAGFVGAKNSDVADQLQKTVSSAIETRRLKKELDKTDSDIKVNNAIEQTQKTQQKLNEASAKEKNAISTSINTKLPALREQSKLDADRSKFDQKTLLFDKSIEKVTTGAGGVSSILDLFNPLKALFKGNVHKRVKGGIMNKETGQFYGE